MHGALARHACTLLQHFRHELGVSGAIRSLSSSTSASTAAGKQPQQAEHNAEPENEVDDDIAHSTGEERAELEARREGADPFVLDHQWIFSVRSLLFPSSPYHPPFSVSSSPARPLVPSAATWHARKPRPSHQLLHQPHCRSS